MKTPGRIHLSEQEISDLMIKIEKSNLGERERKTILSVLSAMNWMVNTLGESKLSIKRLKKIIFGGVTEKSSKILNGLDIENNEKTKDPANINNNSLSVTKGNLLEENHKKKDDKKNSEQEKTKGHGRNGKDKYEGADQIHFAHKNLKPGDKCICLRGSLRLLKDPGSFLLIRGSNPITGTLINWDILRCDTCSALFTPEMPEDVKTQIKNRPKNGAPVFDNTAKATMAFLRYGGGFPTYRLKTLQDYVKVPISTSTQWDQIEKVANAARYSYNELVKLAANGDVIHNDDTGMKVLSYMKEIEAEKEENRKTGKEDGRTGIFTTGIVSITKTGDQTRNIVLFFTGRQHAGENLNDLLKHRDPTKDPPIQMCDALSRNKPKDFKTETCNCNIHARRGFVDVIENFEEARFVIDQYKEVYRYDAHCKEKKMSDEERLTYHKKHSGPVMDKIIKWCNDKIKNKEVEPNSSFGKAITYMQNHWDKLTKFLKISGAPIDNNINEQIIKTGILHRKNSLFYKTENGANVGDILMSLIQTCVKSKINPLDYLIALQDHAKAVFKNPKDWLPWNYKAELSSLSAYHALWVQTKLMPFGYKEQLQVQSNHH